MIEYFIAFAGGALAILSPCSSLLLPAFFALAFASRARLLGQAALFYAGLATIFVPLGLGVSQVAALFYGERDLIVVAAGLLLVGFGAVILAGGGFEIASGLGARLHQVRGRFAAYATGLAYGFAGFCSGPILGAVLTVAATAGGAASGAVLLAVYALGMTLPVFALALLWDRLRVGERPGLLTRTASFFGRPMPLSRLLAGSLFVALGVSYVALRGSSALAAVYEDAGIDRVSQSLEAWIAALR